MSKLVIVESPSKIKTVKKTLGSEYNVMASKGHIRDLPKSKFGIDVKNGFKLQYINMPDKKELIKELQYAAANSEFVYLATDPDREGEAISWHLSKLLSLNPDDAVRVSFNEITESGIKAGMSAPRKIDMNLVDAQQARRVLDRIIGYNLSPFLWKKVKSGLSAGRVQSVALRLVVDREREIEAFKSDEYWTIDAKLFASRKTFTASLYGGIGGDKINITDEKTADTILSELSSAEYVVNKVKNGVRNKQPAYPFITSTLQQDASRKLGFTGQKTMRIAQQLYEGIDIVGVGTTGLITYMRTDSLRISEEARFSAERFIVNTYGDKYLPKTRRTFKSKSNSQDAHEAIRPTNVELTPAKVKDSLSSDQYKLYKLIWERFVASLMSNCVQNTVAVDIVAGEYIFKASGYSVKFDGFTVLYEEGKDEDNEENNSLPAVNEGDVLKLKSISPNQHFTQPPSRYSEPTLIKALDDNGIGRPSTYAPIITNILQREYIERDKKTLKPTSLGMVVSDLMVEHFKKFVDIKFTAGMENSLDKIGSGDLNWIETIADFYGDFDNALKKAEDNLTGKRVKVPVVESEEICEKCGKIAPIDAEKSTANWTVYKIKEPCECGGEYKARCFIENSEG